MKAAYLPTPITLQPLADRNLRQADLEGQATGEFRSFDARIMALNLRATIDKFSSLVGAGREVDLESYIREMIELFDHATRKARE